MDVIVGENTFVYMFGDIEDSKDGLQGFIKYLRLVLTEDSLKHDQFLY